MNPSVPWYLNLSFLTPIIALAGVIVGGLISGFGGWMIAKGNRSHEFERERRRRKQDCLERVVEDLDESWSAIDELAAMSKTVAAAANDPNKTAYLNTLEEARVKIDKSNAALNKFRRSQSKLIICGFEECAEATNKYLIAALTYHVDLDSVRAGNHENESDRQTLLQCAEKVQTRIKQAFTAL